MDRRCKESEGKAKIEGYMSVSDEEAHQRGQGGRGLGLFFNCWILKATVTCDLYRYKFIHQFEWKVTYHH